MLPTLRFIVIIICLQFAGHGFDQAIKKETSGDLQKAYLTIYAVANDVHGYYAEKIQGAMKGMGTKESALIQNIVSRVEVNHTLSSTNITQSYRPYTTSTEPLFCLGTNMVVYSRYSIGLMTECPDATVFINHIDWFTVNI